MSLFVRARNTSTREMNAAEVRESIDEWIDYIGEAFWGPTPAQMLRRSQLKIRESERKLERERARIRKQESDVVARLRAAASSGGQKAEMENMALMVARCRRGVQKIDKMCLQLSGISQDLLTTDVTSSFAEVIRNVNVSLNQLTGAIGGTTGMGRDMMTFQRERDKLDLINESLEETLGNEDEAEDAETTLASLADELDLKLAFDLPEVKRDGRKVNTAAAPQPEEEETQTVSAEDMELLLRFEALKFRGRRDDDKPPPPPVEPPVRA